MRYIEIPEWQRKILARKGVNSCHELWTLYPKKYFDMREPREQINKDDVKEWRAYVGTLAGIEAYDKKGQTYVTATLLLASHETMTLRWIGLAWMFVYYKLRQLHGQTVTAYGRVTNYFVNGEEVFNMFFPPYVEAGRPARGLYPVWGIKGLADQTLQKLMEDVEADEGEAEADYLPPECRGLTVRADGKQVPIPALWDASHTLCLPDDAEELEAAQQRFLSDDLLYYACRVEEVNRSQPHGSPVTIKTMASMKDYISSLPYDLTQGQREAVETLAEDMKAGIRVDGIVQGDVGCGKTTVAFALMFLLAGNGYQSVLCAPSVRVASQHFAKLQAAAEAAGYEAVYLSGDIKGKVKKEALAKIASGEALFIVGTHAVLSKGVKYKNLGLQVIDEEHQFGVNQKNDILSKGIPGMHVVHMSATPIPATAAKTAYSDQTKLLVIKDKPEGRKEILCVATENAYAAMLHVGRQVADGHQAYVVCPLVLKSDLEVMEDVASVEEILQYVKSSLPLARVAGITGKTKKDDAECIMDEFSAGSIDVLVATTVIGVGVDVPNATAIVVFSPERFGLSQLHQIRGRVGRGDDQSYCILVTKKLDEAQAERLDYFVKHKDGYELAEKDAQMRGEGNYIGTEQSGSNRYIELIKTYPDRFKDARQLASKMADNGTDKAFVDGYTAFMEGKVQKGRRKNAHN